jgi:5'-methylthioadenosine phosphorylase
MNTTAEIGIIGGSGLYNMEELTNVEEVKIKTPFGKPSDSIRVGEISGRKVAFLPRHGRHHHLLPSEVPHTANIFALKELGVRWLISASAVGSLAENIKPGHFVLIDQFYDRSKRVHTFFGSGIVAHVSFGKPICSVLQTLLFQSCQTVGAVCHWGGTYVHMEGPAFSTFSESQSYRALGAQVIGMTNIHEAKLAREAEISFATVAMSTDYDCWRAEEEEVTAHNVVEILKQNADTVKKAIVHVISQIPLRQVTPAHTALEHAILTPRQHWPEEQVQNLTPLLKRFL